MIAARAAEGAGASGFTLVEVLVAVLLSTFLAAGAATLLVTAADVSEQATERERLEGDGLRAVERFRRDVRRLRGVTSLDVLSATATRFRFVDLSGATVDWEHAAGVLRRNDEDAVDGVTAFSLAYLPATGTASVPPSRMSRIEISITVASGTESVTLRATAVPRCLAFPHAGFGGS